VRILFATNHTYLPERVGGSESSIHELCLSLSAAGVEPAVLARTQDEGPVGRLGRWLGRPSDRRLGYAVHRVPVPAHCERVVRSFRPSLAIVQTQGSEDLCGALEAHGVPCAIYFRDAQLHKLGALPSRDLHRLYLANSAFTAERYREGFGIDALVLPPVVLPDRYSTAGRGERAVFVTPHRFKGFEIVLQIAQQRPEIGFDVVSSWPLGPGRDEAVRARLRDYGNVSLRPRTHDMREVYERARLLLAPSISEPGCWEEGWGRVVSEAQCSGIPVLGSNSGGLPEAIGPGGVVVDANASLDTWLAAFSRIWDEPREYTRLSDAARLHSKRAEIAPEYLTQRLLEAVAKFLG
jgi:glycosyltransferase involved in cell wall biosynthesis